MKNVEMTGNQARKEIGSGQDKNQCIIAVVGFVYYFLECRRETGRGTGREKWSGREGGKVRERGMEGGREILRERLCKLLKYF